ncbi:exonuclease subunit SbcD [Vibrio sp. 10N.286.49.B3]|uniref:exonuclease subunit SbcD n=1 Tax=Vibrio sp. 10N.286.49.B3 TaxID=1880855 RepID=UPI000C837FAC|nr:exonuclease subunit SbcD [Vibrio sp. 10N.286.49.B3]PMH43174.1 exonuclease subunit SbcD [Vibrio sp. 10N.286.49.B3]
MRILHTSDWHLGQHFFTKSRKHEHQAFLTWLLDLVTAERIDALIIAGDVFDTGSPPSYAREMYNQFVVNLSTTGCQLVVLGGNHDSVSTLNESKQLLACLDAYVVANTSDDLDEQIIELTSNGKLGAYLCAVPFVRARDVVASQSGESGLDKQKNLSNAISAHYHRLYQRALTLRAAENVTVPIITTGHLTALGVTSSDSVRDIYIGTLDGFDAKGFPPADYIALGHIHRPQVVAKQEHIRYSGSPIALSFDELKSNKQVLIVDFAIEGDPSIDPIAVPSFQEMHAVKGDLESLELTLRELVSNSQSDSIWLSIEVAGQDYLSDLQTQIQTMIDSLTPENMSVEVLQLRRSRQGKAHQLSQQKNETLAELTPFDVFNKRVAMESFDSEEEQSRLQRITQTFKEIVSDVEHNEVSS